MLALLDLSEFTNETVAGQDVTVLLSDAIATIGDPFAIHGFCSNGRHNVDYYSYKDFDPPYNNPPCVLGRHDGPAHRAHGAAIRTFRTFSNSCAHLKNSCS